MKSLTRAIFVPTAVLAVVIGGALAFLGWESARQARALERDANQVRAATALALALTDAAHEEERWISSLASRSATTHETRIAEAGEHVARRSTEIEAFPLSPRAAEVWTQFVGSRRALRPYTEEVVAAARRGDPTARALALDKWRLMNIRADLLLSNFTAYHLNRLDRTVADLQRRRARTLTLAGAAVAAALLLAAGFAAVLARKVVRPLVEMANAANRIQATGTATPVAGAERRDELGVLARAFNDMTGRLVSANTTLARANASLAEAVRARDEFISIASHELKTPITPLALRVQHLLRVAREAQHGLVPRELVVKVTRNLDTHVVKLSKLVENLLDVSRINSGQLALRMEDFPLSAAVGDALDRVSAELSAANCDVRVEGPPDIVVRGDRSRVEQVLVNLLGNAAKYAPGGPVVVRVAAGADVVEVEVEDAGPGITPQDQQRIFERFERAVADRHVSGLGLGLYIAREIVQAHSGELSVRSEPGRGATFAMRFRRASPGS